MSLLPYALFTSYSNGLVNTDPAISANLVSQNATISTINTNHVVLDGNGLDTSGSGGSATLLLNGVAIATTSNVSTNIANWALYQATSSITYATGGGSGGSIVMSNGIYSNVSTNTGQVNQLTVSTLNGQTLGQFGQQILYRAPALVSTATFNSSFPNRIVTTIANPLGAGPIQGVANMDFAGTVAVSNSSGNPPNFNVFISDNSVSPYTPTSNALGGVFTEQFYPIGPNNIGAYNGQMSNSVQIPFAFSNAPTTLYVIWSEQNQSPLIPTFTLNSVSTNIQCVIGGGSAVAV